MDMENSDLKLILEKLGKTNIVHIQRIVAKYTGKNGLNDKGRFESIPDEYKILADNYKQGYEKFKNIDELSQDEWEKTVIEKLLDFVII